VRHPRQARYNYAKGYSTSEENSRGVGGFGLTAVLDKLFMDFTILHRSQVVGRGALWISQHDYGYGGFG
jgi:hypothetical protein